MVIKIRYGDNSTLLCNPDCFVVNLLSYIKSNLNLPKDVVLDLADPKGNIIDIVSQPKTTAQEHLQNFNCNTFILIKRKGNNLEECEVLLNNSKELLPDFTLKNYKKNVEVSSTSTPKKPKRNEMKKPRIRGHKT